MLTHTSQQTQSLARMVSEGLTEFNEFRLRIRTVYILGALLILAGVGWLLYTTVHIFGLSILLILLVYFPLIIGIEVLWFALCQRICSKRYKKRFVHYFSTMNMGISNYTPKHAIDKEMLQEMGVFGTLERFRKMPNVWTTEYEAEDCFTGSIRGLSFLMHEISVTLTKHVGHSSTNKWTEHGFWLEVPSTLPCGLYISSPDLIHADANPANPAPVATLDATTLPQSVAIQSRLDSHFTAPVKWALRIESSMAYLYVRRYLSAHLLPEDGKVVDYFDASLFSELTEETLQRDIDVLLTLREVAELLI